MSVCVCMFVNIRYIQVLNRFFNVSATHRYLLQAPAPPLDGHHFCKYATDVAATTAIRISPFIRYASIS